MTKNIIIAVLAVCVLWLSVAVVRLENFHYASLVGMCPEFKADTRWRTPSDTPVCTASRHALAPCGTCSMR